MAQSAGVAKMRETWRGYGPADPVTLSDVRQAGAAGIVTALHEVPIGDVWPRDAILRRKALIEAAGLRWDVVESVPVHESIKQGTRDCDAYLANYAQTLRNLGACGIHVVVYNFMPVIDWTRTDLRHEWHDGSHALSFDRDDFAAFDLHLLRRPGAEADYDQEARARAKARFDAMPPARRAELERTVTAGLPGRMVEAYTLAEFQTALDAYASVPEAKFRDNLVHFLKAVVPAAECAAARATASACPPIIAYSRDRHRRAAGVYLALHPDDPPIPLLGLPRVVSTASDVEHLLAAEPSPHNGLTFCVGSYGSSAHNDVQVMSPPPPPPREDARARRVLAVCRQWRRRTRSARTLSTYATCAAASAPTARRRRRPDRSPSRTTSMATSTCSGWCARSWQRRRGARPMGGSAARYVSGPTTATRCSTT